MVRTGRTKRGREHIEVLAIPRIQTQPYNKPTRKLYAHNWSQREILIISMKKETMLIVLLLLITTYVLPG